jgi:dTDP-4-amino-4,6-dideoxygalactose transaminase
MHRSIRRQILIERQRMMKQLSLLDLRSEFSLFADDIRRAVNDALESQQFIGGPAVTELEQKLAERLHVGHAVAVSSGTDALLCSLMALGVGHGDEVVLPAFTFFATAGVVARLGARPVFVDVDPRTFNIDPECVAEAISDKTSAILAVHLFGQCAEMDAINGIASASGTPVVEDAAQAIDATYKDRLACSLGRVACLSFYPTKNLGGFGEGGMILSNDHKIAEMVRRLRNHGESAERYIHYEVGGNFRLDTMKAAILLVKLRKLDEFTARRRRNAELYDVLLESSGVTTPHVGDDRKHVYHQYSILCDRRDELRSFLSERGIGSGVYYPVPLHLQPCFAELGYTRGDAPVAEEICNRILSLPCHPMLSDDDVRRVAACVHEFCGTTMPSGEAVAQQDMAV